ncbi:MAG: sugar phosphate isomerase/epimerase [Magnetococcales bacterium]|nr:sugar phosphate isomerase/epimerase [Magnetococcales bacterium]
MRDIGFIQGRLSPIIDGQIQAFPVENWKQEFPLAELHGFPCMEWTIGSQEPLLENPLMTSKGQAEISDLCKKHKLQLTSLTGDCFMHKPFWKAKGIERDNLLNEMSQIISATGKMAIPYIVVPLVDNGQLENQQQIDNLYNGLDKIVDQLKKSKVVFVFESDFTPDRLKVLIDKLDPEYFGINYDSGNSSALGYDPQEEINTYASRIYNVHVKDRLLGGTTVPFGEGNADLPMVFKLLKQHNYQGRYMLQPARATDDNHAGVLCKYRDQVLGWLKD